MATIYVVMARGGRIDGHQDPEERAVTARRGAVEAMKIVYELNRGKAPEEIDPDHEPGDTYRYFSVELE